jgi:hypothetical protein
MWPIYVINLDREPARLASMAAQLDGLGLGWQRVAARDRLREDMAAAALAFGAQPGAGPFPATPGDFCCSLTHRDIWQRTASDEAPGAVILEDDARLSPAFTDFMALDVTAVIIIFLGRALSVIISFVSGWSRSTRSMSHCRSAGSGARAPERARRAAGARRGTYVIISFVALSVSEIDRVAVMVGGHVPLLARRTPPAPPSARHPAGGGELRGSKRTGRPYSSSIRLPAPRIAARPPRRR